MRRGDLFGRSAQLGALAAGLAALAWLLYAACR